MFVRALAEHSSSRVIVNGPNPGFCVSELRRDLKGFYAVASVVIEKALAMTTEEGSRQLVWAGIGGNPASGQPSLAEPKGVYTAEELHGQYTSLSMAQEAADHVLSPEGKAIQERVWVRGSSSAFSATP